MARYEVETDLIIHTKVRVVIDADGPREAIDRVAELMPHNWDLERAKGWRATVTVHPPRPLLISGEVKAYHFEQASGADRARKVPS